jgi:oligoendopeptidase F
MKESKYKTEWNLGLLYKNEKDPQIEKDVVATEKAISAFERKYKGKDFTSTAKKLTVALKDFESLKEATVQKPWRYFALKSDLNSDDSVASAAATRLEQRLSNASNKITFFTLTVGKIEKKKQKEYLNDTQLAPFKYSLERIFNRAEHTLSEKEEQLENLLSQTSYGMWVDGQQRVLSQQTVRFNNEDIPLPKALSILADLPARQRHELDNKISEVLKANSPFAEAEINAIFNYKKIMDELRGYKKPYSATVLGYENDEKTIESLVNLVTRYFSLSNRFYTMHAKLLGEKTVTMADRNTKIGKIDKKFDFDSSVKIVKDAFSRVGPEYAAVLDSFLEDGQIDVFPKKGKKGGAYCWGMGTLPTVVLLNHTDDVRSVETLAHEMGHAIHTEYSKKQPPRYRQYSTATAEVASTFFEQLVTEELEKTLSEEEKIILLHNKILGDVSTIFRQIACFNFELELHNKIRSEGEVSRENIAKLLQKNLAAYVGKSVSVTADDGYFFVNWSHIRRFFYVYSYAYGQLVSRALYENWKKDHSYSEKIKQFLSAGRSMSPKDIFKSIGINTNEAFFESGLKGIEADIKKLERLAKKYKKI